jgi:2-octaprenyl-6-methoxyphenol hydroxylase
MIDNKTIAIAGGGLVGSVAALTLANAGFDIHVIDKASKATLLEKNNDGRTTAVTYASSLLFQNLGVWDELRLKAEPIWRIHVMEGSCEPHTPWQVTYDSQEDGHPMGYIVENDALRHIILEKALSNPNVSWYESVSVLKNTSHLSHRAITLSNDAMLNPSLFIGCEGKHSPTRAQESLKDISWSYGQKAMVVHVVHEKPHDNRAFEVFLPHGPLAFLPMKSEEHPKNMSGIVWSIDAERFDDFYHLNDEDMAKALQDYFPYYGAIRIASKRWSYPLTALYVPNSISNRCVLIGDAAHVMHPIAGQGVNLGWRDVAMLRDVLKENADLGLDIGSHTTLYSYEKNNKAARKKLMLATHGLFRLFNNDYKTLKLIRNLGLGITEKIPFIKEQLKRQAMGLMDPIPELMR